MATTNALHSYVFALGLSLLLVACDGFAVASATDRPIAVGASLGYAMLKDSPFIHGRELRVFTRPRQPQAQIQPRIEFLSQSFDLDASRLTQAAVAVPQLIGGDRRLRAALAGLQWNLGRPRRVRAYLIAEGGFSWARERSLLSDGRRFSDRLGRWMASGAGGLESRFGSYGSFIEVRYGHRFERADAFYSSHPWSVSAGLVF